MKNLRIVNADELNALVSANEKVAVMVKNKDCAICNTFEPSLAEWNDQDDSIELVAIELTPKNHEALIHDLPFLKEVQTVPVFIGFKNRQKVPGKTSAAAWSAIKALFE